jgi:hypothetical protein
MTPEWRQMSAEEMRAAAAKVAREKFRCLPFAGVSYSDWHLTKEMAGIEIAKAIEALPIPSPPRSDGAEAGLVAAKTGVRTHPDAATLIACAARIAREGCLVPPDGGSPSEDERQMCARIAEEIEDLL